MASSKDRQRKLARAKWDRQQARRAERERRRRRISAGVGATLAVLLIAVGGAWIGGAFDSDEPVDTAADADVCLWTPQNPQTNADLKEAGTPPTKDLPQEGTETMTVTTDKGEPIVVSLDVASSPCAAASFTYLAGKAFFDNTECHELTTDGALRCGDPSGTGQGGPTYSYYDENLPALPSPEPSASAAPATEPVYPKGTVAVIGNPKGSNGSQFLIFHKDFTPTGDAPYSIIGKVTGGLDTLAAIAKIPTVENAAGEKVKPKDKITIKTLTVAAAAAGAAPSSSAQS